MSPETKARHCQELRFLGSVIRQGIGAFEDMEPTDVIDLRLSVYHLAQICAALETVADYLQGGQTEPQPEGMMQ